MKPSSTNICHRPTAGYLRDIKYSITRNRITPTLVKDLYELRSGYLFGRLCLLQQRPRHWFIHSTRRFLPTPANSRLVQRKRNANEIAHHRTHMTLPLPFTLSLSHTQLSFSLNRCISLVPNTLAASRQRKEKEKEKRPVLMARSPESKSAEPSREQTITKTS